ncbi:hypothetical protein BGZ63DRAFT_417644 [Mariannaea sp. PMI_226]|nr:hypothetical protein BGZ63DRAFT_417644 [Mariannaea sp. PMI_226]
MRVNLGTIAGIAILYAYGATATTSPYCPTNNVCFRWGVPESAATSGSGDVYIQIKAPTSYSWVALGTGSRMDGSKMFIVYTDGNGNVTLSPRTGRGHNEPEYSSDKDVELIEGSKASSSEMVANIRCRDCSSQDLHGSNPWIAAWKKGSPLDSTSPSESIAQHDDTDNFKVDFTAATFSSSGNPFSTNSSTNSTSGSSDGVVSQGGSAGDTLLHVHGVVMAIVFVLAYPLGAVAMPLVGNWLLHAGWQIVAFIGTWVGFGVGYVLAKDDSQWWNNTHVKMGTIVCVLLIIQPILGWLHHLHFLKYRQRGLISHAHIWYGRVLMAIGIVNGGLGLQLASAPNSLNIAYAIVSVIISLVYIAGAIVGAVRRKRNSPKQRLISSETEQEEDTEGYELRSDTRYA